MKSLLNSFSHLYSNNKNLPILKARQLRLNLNLVTERVVVKRVHLGKNLKMLHTSYWLVWSENHHYWWVRSWRNLWHHLCRLSRDTMDGTIPPLVYLRWNKSTSVYIISDVSATWTLCSNNSSWCQLSDTTSSLLMITLQRIFKSIRVTRSMTMCCINYKNWWHTWS